MKSRKRNVRYTAALLAAAILTTGGAVPVCAGPASVATDEIMYVNLDYYGAVDKINVVKGVNLNGQTAFTDYGTYLSVENMSGNDQPLLGDGSVSWQLSEDTGNRFYYKCGLEPAQMELPWIFDVEYKLNGVPVDGDKLAGASGLVEIHVTALPNERARQYYQDNMLLLVAVPVDLSDCYSVEAEGSQTQNLGEMTAVVFTALPGEEGDYTVRIGTDSFETIGVIMSMMPGTLEDLEHIKDLKEAKDTWQDAGDELYDSLEQMALSIEGMRDGVNEARSGADDAERARQKWSASKDSILAGNDQVLASLTALSGQMETIVPHLQSAREAAEAIHRNLNDVVSVLGDMQEPLAELYGSLYCLDDDAQYLRIQLPKLEATMNQLIAQDTVLQARGQVLLTAVGELPGILEDLEESLEDADGDILLLDDVTTATSSDAHPGISLHSVTPVGAADLPMDASSLQEALYEKTKTLEELKQQSSRLVITMSGLLDDIGDTARSASDMTDDMDCFIEEINALNDTLNTYYPDLQSALDDSKELVNLTTEALNNGISTMTIVQNTLRDSSGDIDSAARESLSASRELLDRSLAILDSTTAMRHANRTMKDVMDEQLDKFDDENRFLFMDPEAEKISFTSDKNPAPNTLQIVMRTEEISLEDEEKIMDIEVEKEKGRPLKRVWNVLVQMWRAIVEIFKNR